MTSQSRRSRGMRTQLVAARYLAERIWPHAESTGSGRPGADILGTPGVSIEVKARRDLAPLEWIKQAEKYPGLPLVIFRPDGLGEASVGKWPVLLRLDDAITLLQEAGYGDLR